MNTVSGRTGLLVTNDPAAATNKIRAAAMYAVPVVDEATFAGLLADVEPGTPRPVPRPAAAVPSPRSAAAAGPLAGRCLLVLGGTHADAAEVRNRIGDLGGIAAVNLTARVTDVVALPGAGNDRRWATVTALGLPVRTPAALEPAAVAVPATEPAAAVEAPVGTPVETPVGMPVDEPVGAAVDGPVEGLAEGLAEVPVAVLSRGAVTDLPDGVGDWTVSVTWPTGTDAEVDVVAFLTDADEQVRADADFVFYNQPASADGSVELTLDVRHEALVDVRLGRIPDDVSRIIIAAALPGTHTFGDLGPVEFVARTGDGATRVRATLDAATTERSLLLAHVYRRDGRWRLRAIGQGYDHGLAELATLHGVTVEDD
ncbi:TerD family protein [Dactylosporangium sp. NBC_01737]|uniref:TerD family protein n=1 Tax=Dactylosporangium sp. NBC_01737 TaxID=2975959 RepID=UPI002E108F70|nr:TerD family protein [Dactylosporangium sp. NBC_01737]